MELFVVELLMISYVIVEKEKPLKFRPQERADFVLKDAWEQGILKVKNSNSTIIASSFNINGVV